jgi:L-aminopeptidase/D-esterase-like protein
VWEATPAVGPGPHNDLTDVAGVLVGQHERLGDGWASGVTVVLCPDGVTAACDVRGGAPGTRETDLLDPVNLVQQVHAVLLAGGSAYGLDAAPGVVRWLEQRDAGYRVGDEEGHVVPIVPAAVLFDLKVSGWGKRPDPSFGLAACDAATDGPVRQGTVGAGTGAMAGPFKGGVGSASCVLESGVTVAALVAVNARGHAIDPVSGLPFGAALGFPGEFEHLQAPDADEVAAVLERLRPNEKLARLGPADGRAHTVDASELLANTTIGVVATDASLTKVECAVVARVAHDGLARSIRPVHTRYDGDALFALATGRRELAPTTEGDDTYGAPAARPALVNDVASAAADCVARAVAHAMLRATSVGPWLAYLEALPSAVAPPR